MTQTTLTEHSTGTKEQNPPMRIDLAFAMVQLGNPLLWSIVDSWLLYFYLPPEGKGIALVPVALYSTLCFIALKNQKKQDSNGHGKNPELDGSGHGEDEK